jgi:hypothetical protein
MVRDAHLRRRDLRGDGDRDLPDQQWHAVRLGELGRHRHRSVLRHRRLPGQDDRDQWRRTHERDGGLSSFPRRRDHVAPGSRGRHRSRVRHPRHWHRRHAHRRHVRGRRRVGILRGGSLLDGARERARRGDGRERGPDGGDGLGGRTGDQRRECHHRGVVASDETRDGKYHLRQTVASRRGQRPLVERGRRDRRRNGCARHRRQPTP